MSRTAHLFFQLQLVFSVSVLILSPLFLAFDILMQEPFRSGIHGRNAERDEHKIYEIFSDISHTKPPYSYEQSKDPTHTRTGLSSFPIFQASFDLLRESLFCPPA